MRDAPLWTRKARAYQAWLVRKGDEDMPPSARDAAALQSVYDEDDDLERFWM